MKPVDWLAQRENHVAFEDVAIPVDGGPDVCIRRYEPRSADSGTGSPLLWVHGGAFIGGGLDQHESHAVALAIAASGRSVFTVAYRLAPAINWIKPLTERDLGPGDRYPAALDDVSAALNWITDRAPAVAIGGASAGAALAAAATLRNRDRGGIRPEALVLAYGTFHSALPEISSALRRRIRGRHGITQFRPSTVDKMNLNYAGAGAALDDPQAFPGGGNLLDFPRTLLLDADRDSLRSSGEKFHAELKTAKVDVTYRVIHGTRHGFFDRPGSAQFDEGIATVLAWLDL